MSLESKLVDALATGNKKRIEKVFEEIYCTYYGLVYFCIHEYVDQKEDVEDLANDSFVKFFNHADHIHTGSSIKYYLTTVAKNNAFDFLREKQKKDTLPQIRAVDEISDNASYSRDLYLYLKHNLTTDEFDLIYEHVILGRSLRSIAKNRDISPNTVTSRYRRLVKRIQAEIGEKFYD